MAPSDSSSPPTSSPPPAASTTSRRCSRPWRTATARCSSTPAPPAPPTRAGRPAWWAPVVPYVAQLHAAWWAWAAEGRARHPRLRSCFVALAGLGPLHGERQRARGGDGRCVDPLTFVETSSYGLLAVDSVIRVLGIDGVCHGSDRPYAAPQRLGFGAAALHAIETANPGRLLASVPQEVYA